MVLLLVEQVVVETVLFLLVAHRFRQLLEPLTLVEVAAEVLGTIPQMVTHQRRAALA
jgi:hypothetical protein